MWNVSNRLMIVCGFIENRSSFLQRVRCGIYEFTPRTITRKLEESPVLMSGGYKKLLSDLTQTECACGHRSLFVIVTIFLFLRQKPVQWCKVGLRFLCIFRDTSYTSILRKYVASAALSVCMLISTRRALAWSFRRWRGKTLPG